MTKAVLEAESPTAAERTAAAVPSTAMAVPATLQASLMARLDRLGDPARELAQIGAAIGREFSHALLQAVVGKPDVELQSALDRLGIDELKSAVRPFGLDPPLIAVTQCDMKKGLPAVGLISTMSRAFATVKGLDCGT